MRRKVIRAAMTHGEKILNINLYVIMFGSPQHNEISFPGKNVSYKSLKPWNMLCFQRRRCKSGNDYYKYAIVGDDVAIPSLSYKLSLLHDSLVLLSAENVIPGQLQDCCLHLISRETGHDVRSTVNLF